MCLYTFTGEMNMFDRIVLNYDLKPHKWDTMKPEFNDSKQYNVTNSQMENLSKEDQIKQFGMVCQLHNYQRIQAKYSQLAQDNETIVPESYDPYTNTVLSKVAHAKSDWIHPRSQK